MSGSAIIRQAATFGGAGVCGFLMDVAVFTSVFAIFPNPYVARIISYLAAATTTWFLNRKFTFGASDKPARQEWARFVTLQLGGGAVNYGVFAWLVSAFATFAAAPVMAIAAGSLAGMAVNFATAKFLVFQRNPRVCKRP